MAMIIEPWRYLQLGGRLESPKETILHGALSTNAPDDRRKAPARTQPYWALGTRTISCSARRAGIRLRMQRHDPHGARHHQQHIVIHRPQRRQERKIIHA